METKRVVIATVICLAILLGWTYLSEFMGWVQPPPVQQQISEQGMNATNSDPLLTNNTSPVALQATTPLFAPAEGNKVVIDTPLYKATIHTGGAILTSYELKHYSTVLGKDIPVEMISHEAGLISPMGILLNGQPTWHIGSWKSTAQDTILQAGQETTLVFEGTLGDSTLQRSLTFSADTYLISENIQIISQTPAATRISYSLATSSLASPDNSYDVMKLVYDDGSLEDYNNASKLTSEGFLQSAVFQWAGVSSNYFLAAVAPVSTTSSTLKARIQNDVWRVALEETDIMLQPNQAQNMTTYWWFGPKERELLKLAPQDLGSATYMGMFNFIALPMLWLMELIYDVAGNWGIAIIVLTILIKLIFWPLTKSSYTSMEKMKRIQPMMQDLQKKHANDKQQLSQEMMQLYKTYGVNPLGGCLPILIQIPVFFALYQALLHSIALRHSSFITYLPFTDYIWLADLSAKDPFYITPIIMGGTMLLQQFLTPAMGDPMQRKMMMFMPVIFTFLFLNFPSGLVLYWLMSNVLSIAQQWYTLRKIK